MWESCRTMSLVGGFSRGSPVIPSLSFRRRSIPRFTPIGSHDLDVKSRPNIFTHSLTVPGSNRKQEYLSVDQDGAGGNILELHSEGSKLDSLSSHPDSVLATVSRNHARRLLERFFIPCHDRVLPRACLSENLNRARFPARSLPHFHKWESCRTIPLIGLFTQGVPVPPRPFHSGAAPYSPHLSLISSQDLDTAQNSSRDEAKNTKRGRVRVWNRSLNLRMNDSLCRNVPAPACYVARHTAVNISPVACSTGARICCVSVILVTFTRGKYSLVARLLKRVGGRMPTRQRDAVDGNSRPSKRGSGACRLTFAGKGNSPRGILSAAAAVRMVASTASSQ
ncbi:hypothetical protein PR048_022509 [Dryococelus australis]|uniref:Uncharacterized protein n=1 Tax=Dryococelus australis TaxID=614101 RepID=A0ABQ9H1G9_9NEOP|nr:hypothetical protein PR048_022509 [Dryococelus australis]